MDGTDRNGKQQDSGRENYAEICMEERPRLGLPMEAFNLNASSEQLERSGQTRRKTGTIPVII